jgi:hypothetical protein
VVVEALADIRRRPWFGARVRQMCIESLGQAFYLGAEVRALRIHMRRSVPMRPTSSDARASIRAPSSAPCASIDWGDGAPTRPTRRTRKALNQQTHTYNSPGTYTATVTVTDKDGGEGSNTSSSTITITQEYTATFQQPFDPSTAYHYVINQAKAGRTVPVRSRSTTCAPSGT